MYNSRLSYYNLPLTFSYFNDFTIFFVYFNLAYGELIAYSIYSYNSKGIITMNTQDMSLLDSTSIILLKAT